MHITINDSPLELTEDVSLFDVLTRLNHPVQGVAVAVNHTIVPKTALQTHQLHHGDSVLIFQAIAGG